MSKSHRYCFDYYPFGMVMPGRSFTSESYRFGFNGMEKDGEEWTSNEGSHLDFGARIYDSRLGRFKSMDPFFKNFPDESSFSFAGNNPIYSIDVDGKFKYPADKVAEYKLSYPMITKYLESYIESDIMNNSKIINAFQTINPNISRENINYFVKWGQGPTISFVDAPGVFPQQYEDAGAHTDNSTNSITINIKIANRLEKLLQSDVSDEDKLVGLTRFFIVVVHEQGHVNSRVGKKVNGSPSYHNGDYTGEDGNAVHGLIWGEESTNHPFSNPEGEPIDGIQVELFYPGVTEKVVGEELQKEDSALPTLPE